MKLQDVISKERNGRLFINRKNNSCEINCVTVRSFTIALQSVERFVLLLFNEKDICMCNSFDVDHDGTSGVKSAILL